MARQRIGPVEWRAHVYRYRGEGVGNGVRVLLLFLADHMDERRFVSVPRATLAKALGVSTAEITTRMNAAKEAGLIDSVRRGRPGVTAVYCGTFPDGNPGVTKQEAKHGMGNPTSREPLLGNPGVAAIVSGAHVQPSSFTSSDADAGRAHQGKDGPPEQSGPPPTPVPVCSSCQKRLTHPWDLPRLLCAACNEKASAA